LTSKKINAMFKLILKDHL